MAGRLLDAGSDDDFTGTLAAARWGVAPDGRGVLVVGMGRARWLTVGGDCLCSEWPVAPPAPCVHAAAWRVLLRPSERGRVPRPWGDIAERWLGTLPSAESVAQLDDEAAGRDLDAVLAALAAGRGREHQGWALTTPGISEERLLPLAEHGPLCRPLLRHPLWPTASGLRELVGERLARSLGRNGEGGDASAIALWLRRGTAGERAWMIERVMAARPPWLTDLLVEPGVAEALVTLPGGRVAGLLAQAPRPGRLAMLRALGELAA